MDSLDFSRDGPVVRLRFQRPEVLNALDLPMARALRDACVSIAADPSVRVVVLSGAGRAFVAGGDISVMREDPVRKAGELIDMAHDALRRLTELPVPVLASLHGAVAGGGLGIALAADLAVAAEGTRFNLAYANIGTSCDCSNSWALPRLVGPRKPLLQPQARPQVVRRLRLALHLPGHPMPSGAGPRTARWSRVSQNPPKALLWVAPAAIQFWRPPRARSSSAAMVPAATATS